MSITFKCPHCNSLVAFEDKHAGRRAKCLSCQNKFVIPDSSSQIAEKIAPEKEKPEKPTKGFYSSALLTTWPTVLNIKNLSLLILIIIVTVARFPLQVVISYLLKAMVLPESGDFFAALGLAIAMAIKGVNLICCFLLMFVLLGRLWSRYIDIAYFTSLETDDFVNSIEKGTLAIWEHGLKKAIFLALIIVAAFFPLFFGMMIFQSFGVEYNLFTFKAHPQIIIQILALISILISPSVFISLVINRDFSALAPANILPPIYKALIPYVLIAASFAVILYFEARFGFINIYHDYSIDNVLKNFLPCLALQFAWIILMRVMGLFYRHYSCYFKV